MSGPSIVPLSEVAALQSGGTPSKANSEYWSGKIPWLTPKDMTDFNGTTQESVTSEAIGNGTKLAPASAVFIAVRGMSLHKEIRVVKPDRRMSFNQDIKALESTDLSVTCPPPGGLFSQRTQVEPVVEV
jgi:type I restriction enzyme S subunit